MTLVETIWFGDGALARASRGALAPLAIGMRTGVALRHALYNRGILRVHETAIPAISVGNLTAGGTGKTPLASWLAIELATRGRHPAIVLRGYAGSDEADVHRRLTPSIPVVTDPDRVAGIARSAAAGADIAVLDDAFQHRRARRIADLVLISADQWTPTRRLLPAGPWREPLSAAARATLIVITRKAADDAAVNRVRDALDRLGAAAPPIAVASLPLGDLVRIDNGDRRPLDSLRGQTVHAIAGIGDAPAFFAQLTSLGMRVVPHPFRDHHAFTTDEARRLAGAAGATPVVCTLKDAVKLSNHWPRQVEAPWYVSQRVEFDRGRQAIYDLISAACEARPVVLNAY